MLETGPGEPAAHFLGNRCQFLDMHTNDGGHFFLAISRHDHLDKQVNLIRVADQPLVVDLRHCIVHSGTQLR